MLNFKGGIKPDAHKYTKNSPISTILPPETVKLYTFGDDPCINVGDVLYLGQKLTVNGLCHASVCGEVLRIEYDYITVKNNGENTISNECMPFSKKLTNATFKDIIGFIKNKGIYYHGDFLHNKLIDAKDKARVLIITCGETTPFSCSRYRLTAEHSKEIVYGTHILMKSLGIAKAAITLEYFDSKNRKLLNSLIHKKQNIALISHTSKYPAENPEIQKSIFKKKYFRYDSTVTADNILVLSCEEVAAVFTSFRTGLPMIERIVTVDGDVVHKPKNLRAPIGTPLTELLKACEADESAIKTIILNNPICSDGATFDDCLNKNTACILAFGNDFEDKNTYDCIACDRCKSVCPMEISPKDQLYSNMVSDKCISCGACTYICPAKIDFSPIYKRSGGSCNE